MVFLRRIKGSESQTGQCALLYSGTSCEDFVKLFFVFERVAAHRMKETEKKCYPLNYLCK